MEKVVMRVEVEVDPKDWNLAFGTEDSEVADDVATYVHQLLADNGVFGNGEVANRIITRRLRR